MYRALKELQSLTEQGNKLMHICVTGRGQNRALINWFVLASMYMSTPGSCREHTEKSNREEADCFPPLHYNGN